MKRLILAALLLLIPAIGITSDVKFISGGQVTADTELSAASAITDNMSSPTTAPVASMCMVYDGSTWDMSRGDATNGTLVNLGSNNDVKAELNDGTTKIIFGTGTTKTVPTELNDGTTKIIFGTGTTKNVPVGLNDGTTAITFGTGTQKTVPTAISDGTTEADVIATINSLKTDLSSVAGTAPPSAGVAGVVPVAGTVAHDGTDDATFPIKLGGKASTSKPSAVANADRVNAYFDEYGRLHTIEEGGSAILPSNYVSPSDFSAAYTSNVTLTISGAPITIDDTNCTITYVMHKPTGSTWQQPYINGYNGVSLIAASNVVTIAGAGTPWASGDTYRVGARCQDKAYDAAGNNLRTVETNPLSLQVVEESLVDTTNVAAAATYYPSSLGMAMLGYKNFSITGKYIDGDATSTTLSVQGTNDEDTTNADWVDIQGQINGLASTTAAIPTVTGTVAGVTGVAVVPGTVCNLITTAAAQTVKFTWDFDNLNYRYIRVVLTPGDATNTAIIKARRLY